MRTWKVMRHLEGTTEGIQSTLQVTKQKKKSYL